MTTSSKRRSAGYGKVECNTWNDDLFRSWNRDRRDIWQYLLTNPHMRAPGHRTGCYVLDPLYAKSDLTCPDWEPTTAAVRKEFEALDELQRIVWDPTTRLVMLRQFFRHNVPGSPNAVISIVNDIAEMPYSERVLNALLTSAEEHLPEKFDRGQLIRSPIVDAVRARLNKQANANDLTKSVPSKDVIHHEVRTQEQEQEQYQEQEKTTNTDRTSSSARAQERAALIEGFSDFWKARVQRAGGDSRQRAEKAWCARRREGIGRQQIEESYDRFRAFHIAKNNVGTSFVCMLSSFLGDPSNITENEWVPDASRARNGDEDEDSMIARMQADLR